MYDIIASIVVFENDKNTLKKAIDSFLCSRLDKYLYIIDNSPNDALRDICKRENTEYIFNNKNIGFGAGHNIAIRKAAGRAKYHLVLNPDVYFDDFVLEELFSFMEKNTMAGSVMPKVLYPDGSLQYVCRLLPSPFGLLLRKLNIKILEPILKPFLSRYELRSADYSKPMNPPYLSGCFMFIRLGVLDKIGLFDERFFLYFEDVDLARRIHKTYQTVYYPRVFVYHAYQRQSGKNIACLRRIIDSGIKYFNKWGWFFDKERNSLNKKTLKNPYVNLE